MKKIICTLLIIVCLFCCVSSYADAFSIRNGIKFGMTLDDILKLEQSKVKRIDDGKEWIEYYPIKIANIENCLIQYTFRSENNTLSSVFVDLCENKRAKHSKVSTEYDTLNMALIEKYGAPLGNRNGDTSIYASSHLKLLSMNIAVKNSYAQMDYKYDEWLFVVDDETAVIKIDHLYQYTKDKKKEEKTTHYLCYNYYLLNKYSDDI